MSYQFENFVENYVNRINDIIYHHIYQDKSDVDEEKNLIDRLDKCRKNISYYLSEEGLETSDLIDTPDVRKDLKKSLRKIYSNDILNNKNIDDFITVMFFNQVEITQDEINKYGQNIINYNISQDINDLYNFQFLAISKKNNIRDTEQEELKRLFQESLDGLKVKDKAEFLANFNIFFEEYLQTEIGQKEIDLIFKKFKENKTNDPQDAKREWMEDLINLATQSSPMSNEINIEYEDSLKIKSGTASKGLFDGFFFIDKTKLTQEESKKLKEVNSLEELNKFKKNLNSIKQIQISATADKGIDIEGNSVMRHALANTVISTTLNTHWINTGDKDFIDLFSRKDKSLQENTNIRNAIITAFRAEYPDIVSNIENNLTKIEKENEQKFIFEKLQRHITEDPDRFIRLKVENIDRNTIMTDEHIKEYFNLNHKQIKQKREELFFLEDHEIDQTHPELNEDLIFEHKNYFAVYLNNALSKKRELNIDNSFDSPLNDLEKHEILLLMQYSAIVKQKTFSYLNEFSLPAAQEYFNQSGEVRGIGANLQFDNQKLSELNITVEDIDRFAIHNFLLSDNAKNNSVFFNSSARDNFSVIIESNLVNDNIDNLYKNDSNLNSSFIYKKIQEFKNNRVFSLKYKDNIISQSIKNSKLQEKDNKLQEQDNKLQEQDNKLQEQDNKLQEQELLKKYEKMISKISGIEELGYTIPEGGFDYKLNQIIKSNNTSAKTLDDNDEVKEFLDQAGIKWRNESFENAINQAYIEVDINSSKKIDNTQNKKNKNCI